MEKVSVVIPVFNQEKYIKECVESVLSQTYRAVEVVVVDDGSTDRTAAILRSYEGKIRYIRQENKGAAAALNKGIKESRGEFIAWLSSDDVYLPTKLEEQLLFFKQNPNAALVYTDFYIIDGRGKIVKEAKSSYFPNKKELIFNLLKRNFINGSSVVIRKRCLEKVGFFDESMKLHADGNMWFRLLKHYRFGHVPKFLLKYRQHQSNASKDIKNMKKFRYEHYRKVFSLYKIEDIFNVNSGSDIEDFKRSSHLNLGMIMLDHSLNSLAISQFYDAIKVNPLNISTYMTVVGSLKERFKK